MADGTATKDQLERGRNELTLMGIPPQLFPYIDERKGLGVRRYGKPLQINNGRDAMTDAFEEAFDLYMYLAQMIMEESGYLPGAGPDDRDMTKWDLTLANALVMLVTLTDALMERDGKLPEVAES